jgi:hypothetical protein
MTSWLYLALGFALFFLLERGERRQGGGGVWVFTGKLTVGLILLLAADTFLNALIWQPAGRNDFRFLSLFLWGLVIEAGIRRVTRETPARGELPLIVSPFFLAVLLFALWTIESEGRLPWEQRFLWGLGLPPACGLFQWLLEGLQERLRLAELSPRVTGPRLLFWLAMLLGLAFGGLQFF